MRALTIIVGLFLGFASPVLAAETTLSEPSGDPVLTVSGEIAVMNVGENAVFDMDMLIALPLTEFQTTTLWTEGEKSFKGVALHDLLELLEVEGGTVRAKALNDYAVEFPVDSVTPDAPIIAYALDDQPMSRRKKGPLWIVYPYDSSPDYRSEVIYSRSIWQLDRIEILN